MHVKTLNTERGRNRARRVKKKNNLQATLVNFIKLESCQTHPANVFGGFHVFLRRGKKKQKMSQRMMK